ncbi:MAG: hypothetical protein M1816_004697 [Peltula sp. TS41687]|nr:MAG: hypothetical protein M1816_004697 [Peltula sp. TS41687]
MPPNAIASSIPPGNGMKLTYVTDDELRHRKEQVSEALSQSDRKEKEEEKDLMSVDASAKVDYQEDLFLAVELPMAGRDRDFPGGRECEHPGWGGGAGKWLPRVEGVEQTRRMVPLTATV